MEANTIDVPIFTGISTKYRSFTLRPINILFACVLVSSIMTCTRAAPSPIVVRVPPQSYVPHSNYDYNPCGVDNIKQNKAIRHSRALPTMGVLRNLELSLNHTLADFNRHNKSKISIQYKDMTKHFVDTILPKNQFAEFKKFKKSHAKWTQKKMVDHILVDLRGKLKFFGKAFYELSIKTVSTHSSSFSTSKRTSLLNALGAKLKSLSCEVETGINATNAVVPPRNAQDAAYMDVGKDWLSNPDTTTIMTLDMSTFALYKKFLQDWILVQQAVKSMSRLPGATHKIQRRKRPTRSTKGTKGTKAPKSKSGKKQKV